MWWLKRIFQSEAQYRDELVSLIWNQIEEYNKKAEADKINQYANLLASDHLSVQTSTIKTNNAVYKTPIICPDCGMELDSYDGLRNHLAMDHRYGMAEAKYITDTIRGINV